MSDDTEPYVATVELLHRMLAGDRAAGSTLCSRIDKALINAALRHPLRRRLPPDVEPRELVNETWSSVMRGSSLARFDDRESGGLLRMLRTVLDRRFIDVVQRAQRGDAFESGGDALGEVPQHSEPSPTSMARFEELMAALPRVLSERDAELARCYAQGWSVADLAARMGMGHSAAERALTRAKRKLEAWLAEV